MAAGRYNFEVPSNGTWSGQVRYVIPDAKSSAGTKRDPVNLTGFNAKLQAKRSRTAETVLFTVSTDLTDDPDALIGALTDDGLITWALNIGVLGLTGTAVYDLLLIDPDGNPTPILEGQLIFEQGITTP